MASAGILAVLLLASLAALVGHFRETPPKAAAVRFQVPLPEKISLREVDFPVVSPNGEYLVFAAGGGPGSTTGSILRVRPLNSLSFQDLPGTEGAYMPFWSPDSRSIGFFSGGKLKKVDVAGGSPQTICDVVSGQSGAGARMEPSCLPLSLPLFLDSPSVGSRLREAKPRRVAPPRRHEKLP